MHDVPAEMKAAAHRTLGPMVVDGELAVSAERGAGDERPPRNYACIADQVTAGRVVGRVHNHIVRGRQLERIRRGEPLSMDVHLVNESAFEVQNAGRSATR